MFLFERSLHGPCAGLAHKNREECGAPCCYCRGLFSECTPLLASGLSQRTQADAGRSELLDFVLRQKDLRGFVQSALDIRAAADADSDDESLTAFERVKRYASQPCKCGGTYIPAAEEAKRIAFGFSNYCVRFCLVFSLCFCA